MSISFAKVKKRVILTGLAIAAVAIALNSYTVVEVGKEKAGAIWGKVSETTYGPGLHVVNPLMDFKTYDTQEVSYSWDNMPIPSQDKLRTKMDVTVIGRFNQGQSSTVRSQFGSAKGYITNQLFSRVPSVMVDVGKAMATESSSFYAEDTIENMREEAKTRLNKMLVGYTITDILIKDINLPPTIVSAVKAAVTEQEKVVKQESALEIKKLKAAELTAIAKAADDSATFNASAVEKAADAEFYRITKVAEGNAKLAASVTPALIKLKEAEAKLLWDGVMPTTVTGQGTGLLMDMRK
jgi:regulator of protease activity HflC (stomatin/prohibitin superfamily)